MGYDSLTGEGGKFEFERRRRIAAEAYAGSKTKEYIEDIYKRLTAIDTILRKIEARL